MLQYNKSLEILEKITQFILNSTSSTALSVVITNHWKTSLKIYK